MIILYSCCWCCCCLGDGADGSGCSVGGVGHKMVAVVGQRDLPVVIVVMVVHISVEKEAMANGDVSDTHHT